MSCPGDRLKTYILKGGLCIGIYNPITDDNNCIVVHLINNSNFIIGFTKNPFFLDKLVGKKRKLTLDDVLRNLS